MDLADGRSPSRARIIIALFEIEFMSNGGEIDLQDLAREYGIQSTYVSNSGDRRVAKPETILAIVGAMGAPVGSGRDVGEALRSRIRERESRWLEPVSVLWEGSSTVVPLRAAGLAGDVRLDCDLTTEQGENKAWSVRVEEAADKGLPLPQGLAAGYHRLTVTRQGESRSCLVIAAPSRVYRGPEHRTWGVFCPLHALRRREGGGAGDHSDLRALIDWTADRGGSLVATLPMLATSFERAQGVSPYSPASRLFGNEFYLDLEAIPELAGCEPARSLMNSDGFRREVEALRSEDLVDYGRQMRLKRSVLELLADFTLPDGEQQPAEFRRFLADYPEAVPFANFMARSEPADSHEKAVRYHLYAQWQIDRQLRALHAHAESRGITRYVDFTVGVDPGSYDVWSRPGLFATEASVGSPPDEDFTKAQNWFFRPIIPDRQREEGHAYLIASIRNHLRYAGALRLDHVMGLHRLYWIPEGHDEGAYVSYPAEELYAILAVESHRSRAWIVGEDLGTVPPEVRPAMRDRGVNGMYVIQHALMSDTDPPPSDIPADVVASVNTHDMPPFASYWEGRDIAERLELGVLDEKTAAKERQIRPRRLELFVNLLIERGLLRPEQAGDLPAVYRACCELLAESPAKVVLVNLEDLWLETEAQNVPGTADERPNWRRKLRRSFDEFASQSDVVETLRRIDALRRMPVAAQPSIPGK